MFAGAIATPPQLVVSTICSDVQLYGPFLAMLGVSLFLLLPVFLAQSTMKDLVWNSIELAGQPPKSLYILRED